MKEFLAFVQFTVSIPYDRPELLVRETHFIFFCQNNQEILASIGEEFVVSQIWKFPKNFAAEMWEPREGRRQYPETGDKFLNLYIHLESEK